MRENSNSSAGRAGGHEERMTEKEIDACLAELRAAGIPIEERTVDGQQQVRLAPGVVLCGPDGKPLTREEIERMIATLGGRVPDKGRVKRRRGKRR